MSMLVAALIPARAGAGVLLVLSCTTSLQAELLLSDAAGTFNHQLLH